MRLSGAQLEQYRADGCCTTEPILAPEECDAIVAEFERLHQQTLMLGHSEEGALAYQPMLHATSPLLTRYIADPRLLEIMLQLVGPNIRMYWEQLVAKPPKARTELPWHQDDGYAPTDPPGYATCWLALDDVDERNGCIWVIPRSHAGGIFQHRKSGPYFRSGIEAYAGEDEPAPAPLPKGGALLFNSLLLQRSGPNHTDRPRRAWIVQYCDAKARHGNTGEALDDRVWVARDGAFIREPYSERPIDVADVFANWTPVD